MNWNCADVGQALGGRFVGGVHEQEEMFRIFPWESDIGDEKAFELISLLSYECDETSLER